MASLLKNKKIHIVGIGGIGMSAIAEILINLDCIISGSDLAENQNTLKLRQMGCDIFIGHKSDNIKSDVELLVFSSAVKKDNPELVQANNSNIPVLKRSEILADIMRLKCGVAVAGTHGKTTTTSLVATILKSAGIDPTYLIGGIVKNLSGHAYVGKGDFFVVEADESDGTFLKLNPVVAGITNIDFDHLDYYGDEQNLINAFSDFCELVPFYGRIILNYDDPFSRSISGHCKKPMTLISGKEKNDKIDYYVENITEFLGETQFDLIYQNEKVARISMKLNGFHNIQNALVAIAMTRELGLTFDEIRKGISDFDGVGRRLEVLKKGEDYFFIDDYGHHPTEVSATIKAVQNLKENKQLVVIFEPHRYTRTKNCWMEFTKAFELADKVYILPIYSAGEEAIEGINSQRLMEEINLEKNNCFYVNKLTDIEEIKNCHQKIILSMGAGKIGREIREIV